MMTTIDPPSLFYFGLLEFDSHSTIVDQVVVVVVFLILWESKNKLGMSDARTFIQH